MEIKDLQKKNFELFRSMFGRTPLNERIKDIMNEAREIERFWDVQHLKEEMGDLLCSVLAGASELGVDVEDLIKETHEKIETRKNQYKTLGRKTKVAILGGAFDPVTKGHIETAQLVLDATGVFDEVWLMPCYNHLFGKQMQSPEDRLAMIELAVQVDGRIKAFDYEVKHRLKGETLNCMNRLLDDMEYDNFQFALIIGADNANTINKWVGWDELERKVPFVVVPREGEMANFDNPWFLKEPHIYIREEAPIDCSSTQVRDLIGEILLSEPGANSEIISLIDDNVLGYIFQNNLYNG